MVECLLGQRRAQMVHHGRILLEKSRSDFGLSRAEVETQLKSEKDLHEKNYRCFVGNVGMIIKNM